MEGGRGGRKKELGMTMVDKDDTIENFLPFVTNH